MHEGLACKPAGKGYFENQPLKFMTCLSHIRHVKSTEMIFTDLTCLLM